MGRAAVLLSWRVSYCSPLRPLTIRPLALACLRVAAHAMHGMLFSSWLPLSSSLQIFLSSAPKVYLL